MPPETIPLLPAGPVRRWFSFLHKGGYTPVRDCPDVVRVLADRRAALNLASAILAALDESPGAPVVTFTLGGDMAQDGGS